MDHPAPIMTNIKQLIISAFGPIFQESTKERYGDLIEKWITYTKKPLDILIRDPDEAMKLLETFPIKHTPENHHTYLTPMVAYLHHVLKDSVLEEKWKKHQKKNWEPIQQRYDENRPSENQKEQIMPFEEILEIRNTLEKGSIERLLLSLYTIMEPVRADYFATELIREGQNPRTENYIIDHKTLIITNFKTQSVHEKIENVLPEELQEELQESLKKRPRRYLFTREDNTPYPDRNQFSKWACRTLTRVLKHPMTLITMRHLYIGYQMRQKTPKELTDMAKKMGHTRSIQRAYEWVPDPLPTDHLSINPLVADSP